MKSNHFVDEDLGLEMKTLGTDWEFSDPDDFASQTVPHDSRLKFVARGSEIFENRFQPTLTLRIDKAEGRTVQQYTRQWTKEYPKFGLELVNSTETKYGDLDGVDIELKKGDRQIRQFVSLFSKEILVFTCSSEKKFYENVWASCEKILKSSLKKTAEKTENLSPKPRL